MWSEVMRQFEDEPAKRKVARFLMENGCSVDEERGIVSSGVRVPQNHVAEEVGVDRRVVGRTIDVILEDEELRGIFRNLSSVPLLVDAAGALGLAVISVEVTDASETGLLADIAARFADHGVPIRQAVVEDPYFSDTPCFIALVDEDFSGSLVADLNDLAFVTEITVS